MSEEVKATESNDIHVSKEDVDAIDKFFKHFKFPTSKEFNDAKLRFNVQPTLESQREFRFQLTKEISRLKGQNEMIDDLFKNVMETSDKISYDMQFDKDLEEIIGVDTTQHQKSQEPSKP